MIRVRKAVDAYVTAGLLGRSIADSLVETFDERDKAIMNVLKLGMQQYGIDAEFIDEFLQQCDLGPEPTAAERQRIRDAFHDALSKHVTTLARRAIIKSRSQNN